MILKRFATQLGLVAVLSLGLLTGKAYAHVGLNDPNGGEILEVGSVFTIEWEILIEHNLENWDLWYSTTGPDGPWIELAMDLPPGDPEAGSIHTYEWTVPEAVGDQTRVRVRQDNAGMDYEDISDGDFSIVAGEDCPADIDGDGLVGTTDLLALLGAWGNIRGPEDVNRDGIVNTVDLLELLGAWGPCP